MLNVESWDLLETAEHNSLKLKKKKKTKRKQNGEITVFSLTHVCRVDSSTLTLWTGPFPI